MALSPLVAREEETADLERHWELARAGQPQLAALYGRRRVGKTFLLLHFAHGKRAIFHSSTRQSEGVELGRLRDSVAGVLGQDAADRGGFSGWEAALRALAVAALDEPLLVVIDETTYLTESTPGFASIVQAVWDQISVEHRHRLFLVLTGSAVGVVERLLGGGGPLFGRPTLRMRLEPVSLHGAGRFLPELGATELIEAYAACGGYPLHLQAWDPASTTTSNLGRLAGMPGGLLLEDARQMVLEELSGRGGYERVLTAIGQGRTRYGEIVNYAGQRVEQLLEVLEQAGLVKKETAIGSPARARPLYRIDDPYLAFWFGLLSSNMGLIEGGQGPAVLQRAMPRWQTHLGFVFERLCRLHAIGLVREGVLPRDMVVGRWWASSGEPCEIDVLGLREGSAALLGEVRWQRDPLGIRDVAQLRAKSSRAPGSPNDPILALWGRGGVDDEVGRAGVLGFSAGDVCAR